MQITDGKVHPRLVSVCPDGTRILFEANAAGGSTVRAWLVSAEGGAPQLLLPEERGPESDVNWSPDGRKIVFGHSPEGGDDPRSDIRILDLDTHQVTIVPGSMGMYSAHWSPDGRYLAALPTKSVGLNTFDFRTRKWATIDHQYDAFDRWSTHRQWVYFLRPNPSGIYRIRPTGGAAQLVVDLKGFPTAGYFSISMGVDTSDNPTLLRDIGTDDIYALKLGSQ